MTLSFYTFLFHKIAPNVVRWVVLPSQSLSHVHTLPAFHTVRGRTPCVVSVLPSCPEKWNYSAVPHLNFFLYSLDLTVPMLSQEKFSSSGSLLAGYKLKFQFCVVWSACPIHIPLEAVEVRCPWLNCSWKMSSSHTNEVGITSGWFRERTCFCSHASCHPNVTKALLWGGSQTCQVWPWWSWRSHPTLWLWPAVLQNWLLIFECLDFTSQALTCNALLGWK